MKKITSALLCFIALAVSTMSSCISNNNPAINKVKNSIDEMAKAYEAEDVSKYLSYYVYDYKNKELLKKNLEKAFSAIKDIRVSVSSVTATVKLYPNDLSVIEATYHQTIRYTDEKTNRNHTEENDSTIVFSKQWDDWKIYDPEKADESNVRVRISIGITSPDRFWENAVPY